MSDALAIVGLACRYPEADSPDELWENALSQRRSFRRIPDERLNLADYYAPDPRTPDAIYSRYAAVLEDYEFDRVRFRIAGRTYRAADLTHWLALDVADAALADAGFGGRVPVDRSRVGVVVGNSLTGEFSRTAVLRLRWPYVRRQVDQALTREGWDGEARARFLQVLERDFKAPFEEIGEDSLAGSLSNTIAGRICNAFDFHGGGYTVDGACASSLLAVTTACTSLVRGDVDLALAGGVDLSLDAFELVGFAKTQALATDVMRVYDQRSNGFWPGEGCGMVVLARLEDALAWGARVYATVRGWGVSSDGNGGLTRPVQEGHLRALRRAYARAGYGISTVSLFEGHGTGTAVGDATELAALTEACRLDGRRATPAAIGSIKANIGHTKAAAGVAGLIKAVLSVSRQVLPPTTGCERAHPVLTEADAPLRVLRQPEPWPAGEPLRAGLSAMGFGGINTHVTIEGHGAARRQRVTAHERALGSTYQDVELFVFAGADRRDVTDQVAALREVADGLSFGQLRDLAVDLAAATPAGRPVRAALLAATPAELLARLSELDTLLAGTQPPPPPDADVVLGEGTREPRVAFAFSGQGAPTYLDGGALARRFPVAADIVGSAKLDRQGDPRDTAVAQPAIVTWSSAAAAVLARLGVTADVALGHSLGELSALSWAGAFGPEALLDLARARGQAMADCPEDGRMAELATGGDTAAELVADGGAVVAAYNAAGRTVISGPQADVEAAMARAGARGIGAVPLRVTRAFHSPLVAAAATGLADHLRVMALARLARRVVSTVTGGPLPADADLAALLARQLTEPVRFTEAVAALGEPDLVVEVGPGRILADLLRGQGRPAVAVDAGAATLGGLLRAVGAAFALGAPVDLAALAGGRVVGKKPPLRPRTFLANPCELAPAAPETAPPLAAPQPPPDAEPVSRQGGAVEMLRKLVATRAELPVAAVAADSRLLTDLHLNSITVAQITGEAAANLGVKPPVEPTEFADATVADLARALSEAPPDDGVDGSPPGVEAWVRAFALAWVPEERPPAPRADCGWQVMVSGDDPIAGPVRHAFGPEPDAPRGLLACVGPGRRPDEYRLLLDAVRAAAEDPRFERFTLLHRGDAAGIAKSLYLEQPRLAVRVVELPDAPAADLVGLLAQARAEAETGGGFAEVRLRGGAAREVPRLRVVEPTGGEAYLGPDDVLLVSGGGKGIGAEAALGLATASGARVALLGRSSSDDPEVAVTLSRFRSAGVTVHYVRGDVADAGAVAAAVDEVRRHLGAPTALLHAAGVNHPARIGALDHHAVAQTVTPKVDGLRNLLAAVDTGRLRLLVAFGSIIGEIGMRGEAHYALANNWLRHEVEAAARRLPRCRCRVIEWSVWSGVGMGHRLGVTDALQRAGVTPVDAHDAVVLCRRVVDTAELPPAVVVTGRFGAPPTLSLDGPPVPLLRFVERPLVRYPGVELVAEASLSLATDPYLADHALDRMPLVPAVLGLEAMAQAAHAVSGRRVTGFADVALPRPISVPPDGTRVVRLAALVRGDRVEVAVRTDETAFGVDHFRATCLLGDAPAVAFDEAAALLAEAPAAAGPLPAEVYRHLLFHGERFQRVTGYRRLRARTGVAEVAVDEDASWFGGYLSPALLLGDFAARDAFLHAAQACVPQRRVLPLAIGTVALPRRPRTGVATVVAVERASDAKELRFDLAVVDAGGALCEVWRDLRLRAVEPIAPPPGWPPELAVPYLERALPELGVAVDGVALRSGGDRRVRAEAALASLCGPGTALRHREDGRPEVDGARVSVAHTPDLTLVVSARVPVGCDLEPVVDRGREAWRHVLGGDRLQLSEVVAEESGESLEVAATRVWTAVECVRKAGGTSREAILLDAVPGDGWVVLRAGRWRVATLVTAFADPADRMVVAACTAA